MKYFREKIRDRRTVFLFWIIIIHYIGTSYIVSNSNSRERGIPFIENYGTHFSNRAIQKFTPSTCTQKENPHAYTFIVLSHNVYTIIYEYRIRIRLHTYIWNTYDLPILYCHIQIYLFNPFYHEYILCNGTHHEQISLYLRMQCKIHSIVPYAKCIYFYVYKSIEERVCLGFRIRENLQFLGIIHDNEF